jgi:predicted small secreted protein
MGLGKDLKKVGGAVKKAAKTVGKDVKRAGKDVGKAAKKPGKEIVGDTDSTPVAKPGRSVWGT